jgi:hypothetical protein
VKELYVKRSLTCVGLLALAGLTAVAASVRADLPPPTAIPSEGPILEPALPVPPPAPPLKPMTPAEFVASFKPLPGKYEVLLVHPATGCPVKVCFELPPGCVRKVRVNSHRIEFVYAGRHDVIIRFLCTGKVWVRG